MASENPSPRCEHSFEFSSDIEEHDMKCDKCGEPLEVVSSIELAELRALHPSWLAHPEQKESTSKIPEWWPECPYPESVFTMTTKKFIEAIPDETLRTSISGYCGRVFWNIASKAIFNAWKFDRDFGDTSQFPENPKP